MKDYHFTVDMTNQAINWVKAQQSMTPDKPFFVYYATGVQDIGALNNTLFIYIADDNGTSAEGGFVGMYNEMTYFNGVAEKVEDLIPLIDKWGGPETFPHMAAGWAVAFDAPFKWTKQVASDFGGVRNGTVIHWPNGISEKGGLRTQFAHVIDIAPTILQAAGLPQPTIVNGTPQTPIEGTSLAYTFNNATAAERHTTQYFEMFGNRALYHDGWLARTIHRAPWQTSNLPPLTSDAWELYDVRNDFSLTGNVAAEQPAKLKAMQALFMKEAEKHHVLPLDNRTIERTNPTLAGRPDLLGDRTSLTLYEGMQGMLENTFMNIKNRSSSVTAELHPGRRRERRDPVAGRPLWRLVAVHEGWQADLHLQFPRTGALHRGWTASTSERSRNGHSRLRL